MAFCNSCGTNLAQGTRFCNKCGAAVLASTLPPSGATATPAGSVPPVAPVPAPTSGGGALKVILIVVGVIVLIGVLGIASVSFFVWRVARNAHVRQNGENVKVETPIGNFETSDDPDAAARNLGVDIYPGAKMFKNGTSSATFMGIQTATANFQSSDSLDKVSTFYKAKFPNAMATTCDQTHCTIVSSLQKTTVTINMEAADSGTKILITKVTGKIETNSPSSSN
jgi:hypothetical protein